MHKYLCCNEPATIKLWNKHIPKTQPNKSDWFCAKCAEFHTTKFNNWVDKQCDKCRYFDSLECWDCRNGSMFKEVMK